MPHLTLSDPYAQEARQARYERVTRALEWPMALLAFAVIPALLLDEGVATPRVHLFATVRAGRGPWHHRRSGHPTCHRSLP